MFPKHILQSTAMLRRLRLAHISLTRQNDGVSEENTPLEAVHASVIFDAMRGKVVSRQVRQSEVVAPEIALKSQSVRDENGAERQPPLADEDRQQGRLPAIRHDDLRGGRHPSGELNDALREIDEARSVVLV